MNKYEENFKETINHLKWINSSIIFQLIELNRKLAVLEYSCLHIEYIKNKAVVFLFSNWIELTNALEQKRKLSSEIAAKTAELKDIKFKLEFMQSICPHDNYLISHCKLCNKELV